MRFVLTVFALNILCFATFSSRSFALIVSVSNRVYCVDVTVENVAITAAEAYAAWYVKAGTLTFAGTSTVNGAAPAEAVVDVSGIPDLSGDAGEGAGDGAGDETPEAPADDKKAPAETTAPATDDAKKGCGGSIGIGALAIVAVAGAACGLVSKKRED